MMAFRFVNIRSQVVVQVAAVTRPVYVLFIAFNKCDQVIISKISESEIVLFCRIQQSIFHNVGRVHKDESASTLSLRAVITSSINSTELLYRSISHGKGFAILYQQHK